jgi:hypothetical protein
VSFGRAAWLLPAAFATHVAKEAPGFTAWALRHASARYTERDFWRNNALGMAMSLATAPFAAGTGDPRVAYAWYPVVLTQQAVFNPVFHLPPRPPSAPTRPAWGRRCCSCPCGRAPRAGLREGLLTARGVGVGLAMAGAIHAARGTAGLSRRRAAVAPRSTPESGTPPREG